MDGLAQMLSDIGNQGGVTPCSGISLAEVTSIKDPQNKGRVKCRYLTADKDLGETGWIFCLTLFGGKDYGCFAHPNVGDIVALCYEDGDIHRPFVIGSLWIKDSKPPLNITDGKNEVYKFVTPNKSFVELSDTDKKERITLSTPKSRKAVLDDEKELISLTDGKNSIELNGKTGQVEISCEKKLVIKVGSSVTITCDGNSGAVEIKANSKAVVDSAKVQIKASGEASIEGSGSVAVKSSGIATIKGSMTKIN